MGFLALKGSLPRCNRALEAALSRRASINWWATMGPSSNRP